MDVETSGMAWIVLPNFQMESLLNKLHHLPERKTFKYNFQLNKRTYWYHRTLSAKSKSGVVVPIVIQPKQKKHTTTTNYCSLIWLDESKTTHTKTRNECTEWKKGTLSVKSVLGRDGFGAQNLTLETTNEGADYCDIYYPSLLEQWRTSQLKLWLSKCDKVKCESI